MGLLLRFPFLFLLLLLRFLRRRFRLFLVLHGNVTLQRLCFHHFFFAALQFRNLLLIHHFITFVVLFLRAIRAFFRLLHSACRRRRLRALPLRLIFKQRQLFIALFSIFLLFLTKIIFKF